MLTGGDRQQEIVRNRMAAVRKAEKRGEVSLDLKLVRDELYSSRSAIPALAPPYTLVRGVSDLSQPSWVKNEGR